VKIFTWSTRGLRSGGLRNDEKCLSLSFTGVSSGWSVLSGACTAGLVWPSVDSPPGIGRSKTGNILWYSVRRYNARSFDGNDTRGLSGGIMLYRITFNLRTGSNNSQVYIDTIDVVEVLSIYERTYNTSCIAGRPIAGGASGVSLLRTAGISTSLRRSRHRSQRQPSRSQSSYSSLHTTATIPRHSFLSTMDLLPKADPDMLGTVITSMEVPNTLMKTVPPTWSRQTKSFSHP